MSEYTVTVRDDLVDLVDAVAEKRNEADPDAIASMLHVPNVLADAVGVGLVILAEHWGVAVPDVGFRGPEVSNAMRQAVEGSATDVQKCARVVIEYGLALATMAETDRDAIGDVTRAALRQVAENLGVVGLMLTGHGQTVDDKAKNVCTCPCHLDGAGTCLACVEMECSGQNGRAA